MKRIIATITALLALGLPATALAQGECPSTMKPSGNATGSLLGSEVVLSVNVENELLANPLASSHGAVHWKITKSLVYTEPEPSNPLLAKRAWNTLHATAMFGGPMEGAWQVLVTVYYEVWGPGTNYPPYSELNYDGWGTCVVNSATPYHEGVWPTHFGEQRPIR